MTPLLSKIRERLAECEKATPGRYESWREKEVEIAPIVTTHYPASLRALEKAVARWTKLACECDPYEGYTCERCKALAAIEKELGDA